MYKQTEDKLEEIRPFLGDLESISEHRKKTLRKCCCWGSVFFITIVLLFGIGSIIVIAAQRGSSSSNPSPSRAEEICGNPPVLLISTDGFWSGYLLRNITPQLHNFSVAGVQASYMRSSFPTVTFPNHYSIVTGLYPESHGIVNNAFYDTNFNEKFIFEKHSVVSDAKWWKGEPIWVTAALNNLVTGVYFWPGSEAPIKGKRPDYYFHYKNVAFDKRVDTVLGWFDLPKMKRPQFMALYFNEPDRAGHKGGPNSSLVDDALKKVDEALTRLWEGLEQRGISNCVNILITSDHGMSKVDYGDVVDINDILPHNLNLSDLVYTSSGTTMNIIVNAEKAETQKIFNALVMNGTEMGYPFRVFRTEDVPLRLHVGHFSKERYGPIYAIANLHGYLVHSNLSHPPAGNHGYDNIEKDMQAIFIGLGPAFKKNYTSEGFENIQLYSLMCNLLNIPAAPNNGSIGALYHLLDPQIVKNFPPHQAFNGSLGVNESCPFPKSEEIFISRSICEDCVCWDVCNLDNDTILMINNMDFNHTTQQETQFQAYHLPWGLPQGGSGDGACILTQPTYVNLYSNHLHIPLWSGSLWSASMIHVNESNGTACLRRDPRIMPANSANCSASNTTGLYDDEMGIDGSDNVDSASDQYLLIPLTLPYSLDDNISSTMEVLSNAIPLKSSFTTTIWSSIVLAVRDWLGVYGTLHIVTGVVLDNNRDGLRDQDSTYKTFYKDMAVPSHFYLVVTRCSVMKELNACGVDHLEVLGMLFQHPLAPGDYFEDKRVSLRYGLTPLRDIERVTGINFFPDLSAEDQNSLELRLLDEIWPTTSL